MLRPRYGATASGQLVSQTPFGPGNVLHLAGLYAIIGVHALVYIAIAFGTTIRI